MGFYDYLHGQNHKATAVAQDAAAESEKENLVTIRRVFKISPEKMKELGHEDKGEEEGEQKPNGQEESQAQDAAVAEDALSKRHSSTPLEDCKAKDSRYCPYHGAAKMTQELDNLFKQAGIYAQGGVERMKQGKYKVQYSVPPSKKDAANKLISEYLQKPGFEEFDDTDGDDVDDIAKTVKMDKKDDQFAMREEHLERLEADMKKGAKVDPSALYQLRKDHHDLKALGDAAWKARTDAGLAEESSNSNAFKDWAANNPEWKKYREAQAKFDKDYNYLRGNADLAHIEKPEDVIELMDYLNGQIDKIGTFMKAKAGIDALKKEMGITKMPPGLEATAKYNKAMGETGLLARELSEAHKHCVEANESGDIGQQKAAAHELEIVLRNLEENKDIINDAFKAAQEFEAYLKGNTAESLKAASKEAMAKKKAEKAAAEKAAAEAEQKKEDAGEEEDKPMSVAESYDLDFSDGGEVDEVAEIMSDDLGELTSMEGIKDALNAKDHSEFNSYALKLSDQAMKEIKDKMGEDNSFVEALEDVRKNANGGKKDEGGEKPNESSGGEGEKKSYTEAELKGMFESVQEELKKLYKEAGYEKAIDLQKQYEDATGKSIFDNDEIGGAAVNCFHSGTWQVWNGDGVVDMIDIYDNFTEFDKPEKLVDSYKGLTKEIKDFVEKAEKYLSEKGIGKGGSESAKSEKPTASGDVYEDFLTGGHDDTATLYGDAGLSADHEYDKYVKKMDDAIDAAKDAVKNYKGDDKAGFVKKTANELKANLNAIADEQSEGAEKANKKSDSTPNASESKKTDAYGFSSDVYSDMLKKFNSTYKTKFDDPHEMKALLDSAKKGTFDLTPASGGKYSNDMQFLEDIKKAVGKDHPYIKEIESAISKMKEEKGGKGSSSSKMTKAPAAPKELMDAVKEAGLSSVTPDAQWTNKDGTVEAQYNLYSMGGGTLEAIVKKDKDGNIKGITYGVQDDNNFHFESGDLNSTNGFFKKHFGGEKKSDSKSEPKSAASQYTANLNNRKKSSGGVDGFKSDEKMVKAIGDAKKKVDDLHAKIDKLTAKESETPDAAKMQTQKDKAEIAYMDAIEAAVKKYGISSIDVKEAVAATYGKKGAQEPAKGGETGKSSAASKYTESVNKSKGSSSKPASKKTTKDVATGDPMIDGIVSTAFNFVKSGKKATTIPLPEDVPYSKIAKALNELGCQTAMAGEPDSKGYGIVVSPPQD